MTTGASLAAWIDGRTPPVPAAFREWMRPGAADVPASTGALAAEARRSLDRALDGDERPRRGAFDLLAADGFATWACESALEDGDPEASLRRVLGALLE